jgi:hypothetical protein
VSFSEIKSERSDDAGRRAQASADAALPTIQSIWAKLADYLEGPVCTEKPIRID